MVTIKHKLASQLKGIIKDLTDLDIDVQLTPPANKEFGDYSTNAAMTVFSQITNHKSPITNPKELAQRIVEEYTKKYASVIPSDIEKVEIAGPGFINFKLSKTFLVKRLSEVLKKERIELTTQRVMVEYAHPNTHKEMHIGHLRTLITGEAIARLLEAVGAKVFRANYQGDIGPHVAKAIYGVLKLFREENLSLEIVSKWGNYDKAHFLGKGYVIGNQDYEEHKEEIDGINSELYQLVQSSKFKVQSSEEGLKNLYFTTRQWSLDYFDEFYKRFYTKFDRLFFESEVSDCGKKIVLENVGKVFEKDQGAIVFKGVPYGLHTRVFVTSTGYPTYEGKDMCLGFKQYEAFPFDKIIHVVGSEQADYFKVIIKALELIDPKKFKDREYHLSMGMVQLVGRKISSRTGEILRVDWLIDEVKKKVSELVRSDKIKTGKVEEVSERVAIGAIKYSILKVNPEQNVMFDINTSVSLEGDSCPYLQYAYARTRSVLSKLKIDVLDNFQLSTLNSQLVPEELSLLRLIHRFPEVVGEAAFKYSPNILCGYLFDLAQTFNLFYQRVPILKPEVSIDIHLGGGSEATHREFRVVLTMAVSQILKEGLTLLGIAAPERM